jgi:hypothetical protein
MGSNRGVPSCTTLRANPEAPHHRAEGVSLSEIARRLQIGKASVHRILSAKTGTPTPRPRTRIASTSRKRLRVA